MSLIKGEYLANIFEQEVPSGTVNGLNTSFTLSSAPAFNKSVEVFLNGLIQRQGIDYTISSTTITFTDAPNTGSRLYAKFIKARP